VVVEICNLREVELRVDRFDRLFARSLCETNRYFIANNPREVGQMPSPNQPPAGCTGLMGIILVAMLPRRNRCTLRSAFKLYPSQLGCDSFYRAQYAERLKCASNTRVLERG